MDVGRSENVEGGGVGRNSRPLEVEGFASFSAKIKRCILQYLKPKCDNVEISEGKFLSRLLTISQTTSERL